MCTISWFSATDGYHVFFNRDEQKTRPKARIPALIPFACTQAIMPVDPQGGGTWCAVNSKGFTYALLNYYQGRLPKGKLTSRGQIVARCAEFASINEAKSYVRSLNHAKYAPFSLLLFSPLGGASDSVDMLRWTGQRFEETQQCSPLVSSAINYENVLATRLSVYREYLSASASSAQSCSLGTECHRRIHASHDPNASSISICMHREDAQTVSFSQISVLSSEISYFYTDGPPCETPTNPPLMLGRSQ
ncbi:MAG: hypothetical protein ACI9Y1_001328 [Lentisphaeria bacterium]|jgi:hypothetical protein